MKRSRGFSIIEVVIVLSIIPIIIIAIDKVMVNVSTINNLSEKRIIANNYAQESMEIMNGIADDIFACNCSTESCSPSACTRAGDGQGCALKPGYSSCWTRYPKNLISNGNFYLDYDGSLWNLHQLSGGAEENIASNTAFFRTINIENALRDASGNLSDSGVEDPSTKIISVKVRWVDRDINRNIVLKKIVTPWKSL